MVAPFGGLAGNGTDNCFHERSLFLEKWPMQAANLQAGMLPSRTVLKANEVLKDLVVTVWTRPRWQDISFRATRK